MVMLRGRAVPVAVVVANRQQTPALFWIHEEPHDYFRYTPFALQKILSNAGFQVILTEAQGGFFSTLALKINYFSLRLIKGPTLMKSISRCLLWPLWQVAQCAALLLDTLDRHPELETHAYFVVARKK